MTNEGAHFHKLTAIQYGRSHGWESFHSCGTSNFVFDLQEQMPVVVRAHRFTLARSAVHYCSKLLTPMLETYSCSAVRVRGPL
jgi:hypothetical protein